MLLPYSRRVTLILSVLVLFPVILSGCGNAKTQANTTSPTTEQTEPSETTPAEEDSSNNTATQQGFKDNLPKETPNNNSTTTSSSVKATIYFPTSDAVGLVPVERTLTLTNQDRIQVLFHELRNPPSGLVKPLPEGTRLLGAQVKDGVATLNLSQSFKDNFVGGATGEQMILHSIVNTLTSQSDIQSVQFLLEGQKTIAILGEIDTSTPIERNESLIIQQ